MQQSGENQGVRPPVPPFDEESARQKVKAAQDAWNTRDPEKVSLAYTPDSKWRNHDEFFEGREEIVAFLKRKWARELDYRLEKNLWCFTGKPHSGQVSSTRAGTRAANGGVLTPTTGLQRACASRPRRAESRRSSWRWPSGYAIVTSQGF